MSQHYAHARLSHFAAKEPFCGNSDDENTFKSCREQKKFTCHFSLVTLLLTSTKTKQFAGNDEWALIFWERKTQQMSLLRTKLFIYLFMRVPSHSHTQKKWSKIKWDTSACVRSRDRRQETFEWLLLCWRLGSAHVPSERVCHGAMSFFIVICYLHSPAHECFSATNQAASSLTAVHFCGIAWDLNPAATGTANLAQTKQIKTQTERLYFSFTADKKRRNGCCQVFAAALHYSARFHGLQRGEALNITRFRRHSQEP